MGREWCYFIKLAGKDQFTPKAGDLNLKILGTLTYDVTIKGFGIVTFVDMCMTPKDKNKIKVT